MYKNGEEINKFLYQKKCMIYLKKIKKKIIRWDCKMLKIPKINYKICDKHDNIGLEYVNKIVGQIEKYISLQEPTNNGVIGINFHKI